MQSYFKYKRGVIVVQNRHGTSAYFGSAVQVQRKPILSTALLMYPPPTWDAIPGGVLKDQNI